MYSTLYIHVLYVQYSTVCVNCQKPVLFSLSFTSPRSILSFSILHLIIPYWLYPPLFLFCPKCTVSILYLSLSCIRTVPILLLSLSCTVPLYCPSPYPVYGPYTAPLLIPYRPYPASLLILYSPHPAPLLILNSPYPAPLLILYTCTVPTLLLSLPYTAPTLLLSLSCPVPTLLISLSCTVPTLLLSLSCTLYSSYPAHILVL